MLDFEGLQEQEKNIPDIGIYTSLHVHTRYSLLDGMCTIPGLVTRAKEIGMKSIAITDHNHLGGTLAFQKECHAQGIKPILGFEAYFTPDMSIASLPVEDRDKLAIQKMIEAEVIESKPYLKKEIASIKKNSPAFQKYAYKMTQYHLILLAQNQTGWKNLVKIQSIAADKCMYNGRFLTDIKLLKEHSEGVICSAACVASIFSRLIVEGKVDEAEKWMLQFREVFGDRFYLEIQPLALNQQLKTNLVYYSWAKKYGIKTIATTDTHYVNKSDWDDHDTLLCISTGHLKTDVDRMKYTNDFWLHTPEELAEAFMNQESVIGKDLPDDYREFWIEACKETNKVSDRVSEDILIGSAKPLYPKVNNIPVTMNSDEVLWAETYLGFNRYIKEQKELSTPIDEEVYLNRIYEEMSVIISKHYSDYFLAVKEYSNWGNSSDESGLPNCVTGPGRGSAGGSLVAFLIGITKNIDPIRYNLVFSRFLNTDRNSPPDIDLDFDYDNRPKMIKHFEDIYGKERVAHIGAWGGESIYTGIKDFGKVLGFDYATCDSINKELQKIDDTPQIKFKGFDAHKDTDPTGYAKFQELEQKYPEIFRLARLFEGAPRQFTTHASGVLVTPIPITDVVPTRRDKETGDTITLYKGTEIEEINLIKFDILGLKTLSIIKNTLAKIGMTFNDLYNKADITDQNVYKMICRGNGDAVFQIESPLFKGLTKTIQPTSIEDLSAMVALGRPGPLSCGSDKQYGAWKKDYASRKIYLKNIDDILKPSYGTIIYQEQLMQISMRVSGFNLAQSDSIVRKILGKKKVEQLEMLRRMLIYGKKNCAGPEGWENNPESPWYDEGGEHYGQEISGAVANGYTVKEMNEFFQEIQGFASYCFNLAHSMAYGYIAFLTAWLKFYYPTEYMAAVLTMQITDKKKKQYINVCKDMKINITVPDINESGENFTPLKNNTISYGLSSVKGVNVVDEIIKNRPYTSIKDAVERLSKKSFNKRVGINLIKAGAFDSICGENRNKNINAFMDARKDKDDRLPETEYTKETCIGYEIATIGSSITYETSWEKVLEGQKIINKQIGIRSIKVHETKKKSIMAYLEVEYDGEIIAAIVFPKTYNNYKRLLIKDSTISICGNKSDKDELLINKITAAAPNSKIHQDIVVGAPLVIDPFMISPEFPTEDLSSGKEIIPNV